MDIVKRMLANVTNLYFLLQTKKVAALRVWMSKKRKLGELLEMDDCVAQQPVKCSFTNVLYKRRKKKSESRKNKRHLDTIPATKSDEVIKSSVKDLVPIQSESEGVPKMCDVPLCENTTPLNALNEHSEIVVNSNDDNSSSDDDSTYGEDIDYVDASPPDVEIVSLEVVEIVDPEVGRIDD
ncbi:hypothetical protein Tco_0899488, partial [Tanacetum coccineum]